MGSILSLGNCNPSATIKKLRLCSGQIIEGDDNSRNERVAFAQTVIYIRIGVRPRTVRAGLGAR